MIFKDFMLIWDIINAEWERNVQGEPKEGIQYTVYSAYYTLYTSF
jgi:hypothetical protein